jgi:hypothetical protein
MRCPPAALLHLRPCGGRAGTVASRCRGPAQGLVATALPADCARNHRQQEHWGSLAPLRTRFNKEPRVLYISPYASCDAASRPTNTTVFAGPPPRKPLTAASTPSMRPCRAVAVLLALCARGPLRNAVCRAARVWRRLADRDSHVRLLQIACRVIGREHYYVTNCAVIPLPLASPDLTVAHPASPPPAHRLW